MPKSEKKKSSSGAKGVKAPIARSKVIRQSAPKFSKGKNGIIVHHREFIQDITTDSALDTFKVEFTEINPGLTSSFPWLSGIAPSFESYKFRRLIYEYVPYCASTTVGTIMLAVDWDVSDWEPGTKQQMLAYQTSVSAPLWEPVRLVCEPGNLAKFSLDHFVRTLDPGQVDLKTYDVGCFYFGTSNNGLSNHSVGSIFVEYEVELLTPQIQADDSYRPSARLDATGSSKAQPFPAATTHVHQDLYEPVVHRLNDTTIEFDRPGQYKIDWKFIGTGLNLTYPTLTFDKPENLYYDVDAVVSGAALVGAYTQLVNLVKPDTAHVGIPAGWTTITELLGRVAPYKSANL